MDWRARGAGEQLARDAGAPGRDPADPGGPDQPALVRDSAKAANSQNVTDAASVAHRGVHPPLPRQGGLQRPGHAYSSFRSLNNHIMMMNKQKTMHARQRGQATAVLGVPQGCCRTAATASPNWAIRLLSLYPSAAKLGQARAQTIGQDQGDHPREGKSAGRVGRSPWPPGTTGPTSSWSPPSSRTSPASRERIKSLKDHLASHCTGRRWTCSSRSSGWPASSAAASIMAEIEDIARFLPIATRGLFGLPPRIKESGDKKGKMVMSKKGRPMIRAEVLYMCASTAVIRDAHI
ncbi:MAG: transposase [Bacteroidia bacterium]